MMALVKKMLQWLYAVYAMLLFVLLMLFVFVFALLALPLGKIRGGNLIYRACMVWADCWFFLTAIRHRNIYTEPLQKGQAYIFVANHISYLDSAIIPKAFRQPVRPLGKVEMARLPIFGLIYKNVIVTVDRSSAQNRARSVKELKEVLQKGISVLVFPEGTFNQTGNALKEFYDGAFRLAIETGTPIKPVLLLDAYNRMHHSSVFSLNPGRSRALFLPAVPVTGLQQEDVAALKNTVFSMMEQTLTEHRAPWIGQAEQTNQPAA